MRFNHLNPYIEEHYPLPDQQFSLFVSAPGVYSNLICNKHKQGRVPGAGLVIMRVIMWLMSDLWHHDISPPPRAPGLCVSNHVTSITPRLLMSPTLDLDTLSCLQRFFLNLVMIKDGNQTQSVSHHPPSLTPAWRGRVSSWWWCC